MYSRRTARATGTVKTTQPVVTPKIAGRAEVVREGKPGRTLTRDDVSLIEIMRRDFNSAEQWLIQLDGKHYLVSAVTLARNSPYETDETMAFLSDRDGNVEDWLEMAFIKHRDHWECIDQLLGWLSERVGEGLD